MRNGFVPPWVSWFLDVDVWELEGRCTAVKLGEKKLVHEERNPSFLSGICGGERNPRPQLSYLYFKCSLGCAHPGKRAQGLSRAGTQTVSVSLARKEEQCGIIKNNFISLFWNKSRGRLVPSLCVSLRGYTKVNRKQLDSGSAKDVQLTTTTTTSLEI